MNLPLYKDAVATPINPPVPSTPSVSARLSQIEAAARKEKYVSSGTALWLVQELRARMMDGLAIEARVRDLCGQIDSVLAKAVAP